MIEMSRRPGSTKLVDGRVAIGREWRHDFIARGNGRAADSIANLFDLAHGRGKLAGYVSHVVVILDNDLVSINVGSHGRRPGIGRRRR
jgi:hypothetical protein